MKTSLDQTCGASVPAFALEVLADLRRDSRIKVNLDGETAWVRWDAGDPAPLRRLLAVPGVELYDFRDGFWYPHGCSLPTFGLPLSNGDALTLDRALIPLPVQPESPGPSALVASSLRLVRDDRSRQASALICDLTELGAWAEMATSSQFSTLSVARDRDRVMIVGRPLPAIAHRQRYWGNRVFSPLGFLPEPDLPEGAILRAIGITEDDFLRLDTRGHELIPRSLFEPMTRAGVRLAVQEMAS